LKCIYQASTPFIEFDCSRYQCSSERDLLCL